MKKTTSRKKKKHNLYLFILLTLLLLTTSSFVVYKNVHAFHNPTPEGLNIQASPIIKLESNNIQVIAKSFVKKVPPVKQTNVQQPSQQTTSSDSKIAYLTFDDGPSTNNTPKILDILKNENVKATFFVIGSMAENNPSFLKREIAEGHAIANHTYYHNTNYNNSTPQAFIEDLKTGENVITSIIGNHDGKIIRFPGGSFSHTAYKQAVTAAGYQYVDWNCLNGDAEVSLASVDRLLRRFHETFENQKELIVLMHDAPGKTTTPEALPEIIRFLKSQGYIFKTL